MTEIVEYQEPGKVATPQQSFFAMAPKEQVKFASEIAEVLANIIDRQKLYSLIQGKKYVKVEGWQTLGTFLGIIPKERSVTRLSDGSYEAFVDLIKFADGKVVGGGSALCSIAEKRWSSADEYARRSMAITRATGKAFRSAFSWIITLAGYEATPEEEIPRTEAPKNVSAPTKARDLKSEIKTEIYTGATEQQKKVLEHCEKENIDQKYWAAIDDNLMNKPFTKVNVGAAVRAALGSNA